MLFQSKRQTEDNRDDISGLFVPLLPWVVGCMSENYLRLWAGFTSLPPSFLPSLFHFGSLASDCAATQEKSTDYIHLCVSVCVAHFMWAAPNTRFFVWTSVWGCSKCVSSSSSPYPFDNRLQQPSPLTSFPPVKGVNKHKNILQSTGMLHTLETFLLPSSPFPYPCLPHTYFPSLKSLQTVPLLHIRFLCIYHCCSYKNTYFLDSLDIIFVKCGTIPFVKYKSI